MSSSNDPDRDWREYAYLRKKNWPDAIPAMGPKREYGPDPWGEKTHDDPLDLDEYPWSHPNAASVGGMYMGDVCPYCGVPLRGDERVVAIGGRRGTLLDVSPSDDPVPTYHPRCWRDREAEKRQQENAGLDEF